MIIFGILYILKRECIKRKLFTAGYGKEEMFVKKTGITVIGAFAALLLIAVLLGAALIKKYTSNKEHVTPAEVYPVAEGEAHVMFWQEDYEKKALLLNSGIYLDLETVRSHINKDFYYDETEKVLSFTTPTEIIRAYAGEAAYYGNRVKVELKSAALLQKAGVPYVSLEFAALFSDMRYTFFEQPARVLILTGSKEMLSLDAKKGAVLRETADIKSRILRDLPEKNRVWYVSGGGDGGNSFVKVMTEDGVYGFVKKRDLTETYYAPYSSDYKEPVYSHITSEKKVVLGWHQVTNAQANAGLESLVKDNEVLTVISPTWFRLADAKGNLSSLADESYVKKAKEYGLEVWALVDNFKTEGIDDPTENSFAVLSSTEARERLINNLIAEAIRYDLDGLNIDFEMISLATGPHFIQFLRELSVKCRINGIVLSVDNYVPSSHAAYYDWSSQGVVVDYVVIMAYDEHYAGAENAGSVASYGYLTSAVDSIVTMVPKEQVIMAVPFYTRLWMESEESGVKKLTSEALAMAAAEAELERNGVTAEWDETVRQYYAEYKKGSATYKIWLEETDSLKEKLSYIKSAGLAGTAAWRLGFEKPEIWTLFDREVLGE